MRDISFLSPNPRQTLLVVEIYWPSYFAESSPLDLYFFGGDFSSALCNKMQAGLIDKSAAADIGQHLGRSGQCPIKNLINVFPQKCSPAKSFLQLTVWCGTVLSVTREYCPKAGIALKRAMEANNLNVDEIREKKLFRRAPKKS